MPRNLASILCSAVILTATGVGLIKSFQDSYYDRLPGVVYLVDGKKVIERRFKTQEEFDAYLNSEKGKAERDYYINLNNRKTNETTKASPRTP